MRPGGAPAGWLSRQYERRAAIPLRGGIDVDTVDDALETLLVESEVDRRTPTRSIC